MYSSDSADKAISTPKPTVLQPVVSGYAPYSPHLNPRHLAPNAGVEAVQCVVGAGDALYVPPQYAHAVVNLEDTVGLALEIPAISELQGRRPKQR